MKNNLTAKHNFLRAFCCLAAASIFVPGAAQAQPSLYMKVTTCDNGSLANRAASVTCNSVNDFWDSPDLWVRNQPIPGYTPQTYTTTVSGYPSWVTLGNYQLNQAPKYSDPLNSQPNYMYVCVHNVGNQASTGKEILHVYWSIASAGLSWPADFCDYMDSVCGNTTVYGMEITKGRTNITQASSTDVYNYLAAITNLTSQLLPNYSKAYWWLMNGIHNQAVNGGDSTFAAHYSDGFLPWHREFLSRYEQLLRQFYPTVTLLYWDYRTDPRTDITANGSLSSLIGGFDDGGTLGTASDSVDIGMPWNDNAANGVSVGGKNDLIPGPGCGDIPGNGYASGLPSCVVRQTGSAPGYPTPTSIPDSTVVSLAPYSSSTTAYSTFRPYLEGWTVTGNHNYSHCFIGGATSGFVYLGNMIDTSFAAQDPIFFLLHANVDKIWSEWQRADGTVTGPYDPTQISDPYNDGTLVARAYNGTTSDMSGPMYPWNGYTSDTKTFTSSLMAGTPYGVGGSYQSSKTANDHSIVFPAIYDVAPLTLPVIPAGSSVIIEIPWYPPNPNNYPTCFGSGQLHTCLLARIDGYDTSYPGGTYDNVVNNLGVAQHNEEVIDPPGPELGGSVLVRNVATNAANIALALTLASNNVSLLNYGQVILDLGNLYDTWVANGAVAQNFVPNGGTTLLLTGPNGVLSDITMTNDQADAVQVELVLSNGYPNPQGQVFQAELAESIQGTTNEVVGGQVFTFDFNELTLVPKGGTWFYQSTNPPASNWNQVGYNDSSWSSGTALLGYGLGDETTVINPGSNITTYFRYDFNLSDVELYSNLWLQLEAYDGAVVYLNGSNIASLRMPASNLTPRTLATSVVSGVTAQTYYAFNVSSYLHLLSTNNVLAVEVHKGATNGTHLGLDGALFANIGSGSAGASNFPPQVALVAQTNGGMYLPGQTIQFTANVVDPLNSPIAMAYYLDGNVIPGATSMNLALSGIAVGQHQIAAVATDANGVSGAGFASFLVMSNLPPHVAITSPTWGQVFSSASQISVKATASEIGGTISKVDFYYAPHTFFSGQTRFGTATAPPYSATLTGLAPGCYMLAALTSDSLSVSNWSVPISIWVSADPTISISYARPYVMVSWWPASAVLQKASSPTGPWQTVTNSTSPYSFIPTATNKVEFFRATAPLGDLDLLCKPPPTSTYIGHSISTNGLPDSAGTRPLVILGEYNPAGPAGGASPLAGSSITLPAGLVQDVKFYGQNYNFTLYALSYVTNGPGPNAQTFQVVASQTFSNSSVATAGIQTLAVSGFPVNAGDLLAFAGIGPYYPQTGNDTANSDATYENSSSPNSFNATPPGGPGTIFSVGIHPDPAATYELISDVYANQGRTYSIGVDVTAPY